jgi:hypothetical protein
VRVMSDSEGPWRGLVENRRLEGSVECVCSCDELLIDGTGELDLSDLASMRWDDSNGDQGAAHLMKPPGASATLVFATSGGGEREGSSVMPWISSVGEDDRTSPEVSCMMNFGGVDGKWALSVKGEDDSTPAALALSILTGSWLTDRALAAGRANAGAKFEQTSGM